MRFLDQLARLSSFPPPGGPTRVPSLPVGAPRRAARSCAAHPGARPAPPPVGRLSAPRWPGPHRHRRRTCRCCHRHPHTRPRRRLPLLALRRQQRAPVRHAGVPAAVAAAARTGPLRRQRRRQPPRDALRGHLAANPGPLDASKAGGGGGAGTAGSGRRGPVGAAAGHQGPTPAAPCAAHEVHRQCAAAPAAAACEPAAAQRYAHAKALCIPSVIG